MNWIVALASLSGAIAVGAGAFGAHGASGDAAAFRAALLRRIAAFALEHPGVAVRDSDVFRDSLAKIRKSVFEEKKVVLARFCRLLAEPEALPAADRERVERAIAVLGSRFGYTERSARDAAGRLLAERYAHL